MPGAYAADLRERVLAAATPNGVTAHPGDLREPLRAAVAQTTGFERDEPAALPLVQPTDEEIDPLMEHTVRMRLGRPTGGTGAPVDG